MAKYSTNSSNKNNKIEEGTICELCSSEGNLSKINLSGTTTIVCKDCKSKHKSRNSKNKSNKSNKNNKDNKNNWTRYATTSEPDNDWVEKTRPNYNNAQTPYLVKKYDDKLKNAMTKQNISSEELSKELNIDEEIVSYILEGNAIRNNVDKKSISKVEEHMDIELQES